MIVSDATIAAAAAKAGFPDVAEATCRALAESDGDKDIVNSIGASGLWQILRSAHPEFSKQWADGSWSDPNVNASMAFSVFKAAGSTWRPWVSSDFRMPQYRTRAAAAAAGHPSDPNAIDATTVADTSSGTTGFENVFAILTDPHTYYRAAMFILGIILCLKGLDMISGANVIPKVTQKAKQAGMQAAEMAVLA